MVSLLKRHVPSGHLFLAFREQHGLSLIAVIGILAVVTIGLSLATPAFVQILNQHHQDQEDQQLLRIANGVRTYLEQQQAFPPSLMSLVPDYVPFSTTQLTSNARGFPRYYAVHPTMAGFDNSTGLTPVELVDTRFLLISHLTQDAAPTINTAAEFEAWWTMDESVIPNLHIFRSNVGHEFYSLAITPEGTGASFLVSTVPPTDSVGGLLPTHNAYHLMGTRVGFDEAGTYANPEVQFALTTNTTYWFDPNCVSGKQWNPLDPGCATGLVLWLSTIGTTGGTPGITWGDEDLVQFDNPNLTYQSGPSSVTNGTFSLMQDMESFTGNTDIDAMHYVTQDITIGSGGNSVALQAGDLLLSTEEDETLTSTNSLFVYDEEVFVFRPDTPGNYSSGTFFDLIDVWYVGFDDVKGVTLVETAVTVGGTNLSAGDILLSTEDDPADVNRFQVTDAGGGSVTAGTVTTFIDGPDINITNVIQGIELVELQTTLGDVTLTSGQVLATLSADETAVGDNSIAAAADDIFMLDMTATGNSSAGNASILFDGSDVNMSASGEEVDGITLFGGTLPTTVTLSFINPGFEIGDLSGWTKTGDLSGNGGTNQWGAVTSSPVMSGPRTGTYFSSGEATGATGGGGFAHSTGLYQRIDISSYASEIDTNKIRITIQGYGVGRGGADQTYLAVRFFDAVTGGTQVGSQIDSNITTSIGTWATLSINNTSIPATTRSLELHLIGEMTSTGFWVDSGFDDLSGFLTILP